MKLDPMKLDETSPVTWGHFAYMLDAFLFIVASLHDELDETAFDRTIERTQNAIRQLAETDPREANYERVIWTAGMLTHLLKSMTGAELTNTLSRARPAGTAD